MRVRLPLTFVLVLLTALALLFPGTASCTDSGAANVTAAAADASSSTPPPADAAAYASNSNTVKAHALVDAAINMSDSDRAVKLLWQATDLDPTLGEAYVYLGLYYNSRSQFDKVVGVYQKLVKYQPKEVSAYLNIGEAYMSFTPPKFDLALPYYRKAFEIEPGNSFAALRIGEIYAQQGNRGEALRFLKLAKGDKSKNPNIASEADQLLRQMGPS
jgi:tetratricopeptide (TPR) repeat protein